MREGWLVARTLIYRQRVILAFAIPLIALLSGAVAILKSSRISDTVFFCGASALALAFLFVFTAFIQADADILSPKSSFPSHFFTLPVKTADLVLWPMLVSLAVVGVICYFVMSAFKFAGYPVDPIAFAVTVVACLSVLQAIFWSPMPAANLRLVLVLLALVLVPYLWPLGLAFFDSVLLVPRTLLNRDMDWVFLAVTALACAAAFVGVRAARLGSSRVIRVRDNAKVFVRAKKRPPFRSPMAAQVWYEWRQHGRILPILVGAGIAFFFVVKSLLDTTTTAVYPRYIMDEGAAGFAPWTRYPNYSTFILTFMYAALAAPAIIAWIVGLGMRKSDLQPGKRILHVFLATRPISDSEMVRAKIRAALLSCGCAWGLMLAAGIFLVFLTTGHETTYVTQMKQVFDLKHPASIAPLLVPHDLPSVPMVQLLMKFSNWETLFYGISVALLFIGLTVRNYVNGLWLDLTGFHELRYIYMFAVMAGVAVVALVGSQLHGAGFAILIFDILLPVALVLKGISAAYLIWKGERGKVFAPGQVFRALVTYTLSVVAVMLLVYYGLNYQMVFTEQQGQWWLIPAAYWPALLALLYAPLARILLAPVVLNRNRHG